VAPLTGGPSVGVTPPHGTLTSSATPSATPVEGGTGALVHFATDIFGTTLEVDGAGLMVNYPGLAQRIEIIH
jgi:hypothetical protein